MAPPLPGLGPIVAKRASGVAPFSPTDIPGLLAWYDSEHVTLAGGDVDVLIDRSGHGHDGTAPTSGQRPTVNTADPQYAGLDSLGWSNANSTAVISPLLTFGPFTMVMVAKVASSPTYIWADSAVDYFYSGTSFSIYTPLRDGSGASAYNHPAGASWAISAVPQIFVRRFDGTHAGNTLRVDGLDQTLTSVLSDDPGTGTFNATFAPLSYLDGTGSSDATFAAVLLYDNAISAPNLALLESYLAAKYGVVLSPTAISGLTSWFRADLGVTLNSGQVASWADQSGAAVEPTLANSPGAQPTFVASGINSLPDITFDGTTWLPGSSALLSSADQITLFGIFRTAATGTQFLWGMQYNAYHYALFMNVNGFSPGNMFFLVGDDANSVESASSGYADDAPHAFVAVGNLAANTMALYIDDGVTPVGSGSTTGGITNGAGDRNAAGSSTGATLNDRLWNGHIPEVGSYSRALTSDEIASLMAYLKGRAGI